MIINIIHLYYYVLLLCSDLNTHAVLCIYCNANRGMCCTL